MSDTPDPACARTILASRCCEAAERATRPRRSGAAEHARSIADTLTAEVPEALRPAADQC
jgi:hypothetical protein